MNNTRDSARQTRAISQTTRALRGGKGARGKRAGRKRLEIKGNGEITKVEQR